MLHRKISLKFVRRNNQSLTSHPVLFTYTAAMDEIRSRSHCEQCALGRHCFTETQSQKAFRALVSGHQHYNANQVLYSEGSSSRYVAVVQSGAVKLVRNEQVIGFALPGDYIGLACLYEDIQPDSAIALERTRVCQLSTDNDLIEHPESARLLAGQMNQQRWHTGLSQKSAPARLASYLLRLSEHQLHRGLSETHLTLPLSRTDTANLLGLALETTSRLLSKMRSENLIQLDGRAVELVDKVTLAELELDLDLPDTKAI